ncbi:unnamed protein product [Vitrella brassicaformis CCMP3155]|uniref:Uncharacterized protein n=2 Tax=Vitrella brassicaformis TaxID=1169539 RepID=A0A0G4GWW0_VITBC|nr:unnamed protein product [Vitrella brassicaformis CCMP3155]|eukprot:CEM35487.1 unnamed protein product [Vitrella brassicaformis CCMP3155]
MNSIPVVLFSVLAVQASHAFVSPPGGSRTGLRDPQRPSRGQISMQDIEKSVALPFARKPDNLNGELVGDVGFDPFGFTNNQDLARMREVELKHGRVCMLATLGVLVQSTYRWNEAFPSKNFLEAPLTAPTLGMIQLLLVISAIEYYNGNFVGRIPGDRGFDPLRLSREGIRENWQLMELKHGRLAMIGFLGMVVQQLLRPDESIVEMTINWAKTLGEGQGITTPAIDAILK